MGFKLFLEDWLKHLVLFNVKSLTVLYLKIIFLWSQKWCSEKMQVIWTPFLTWSAQRFYFINNWKLYSLISENIFYCPLMAQLTKRCILMYFGLILQKSWKPDSLMIFFGLGYIFSFLKSWKPGRFISQSNCSYCLEMV